MTWWRFAPLARVVFSVSKRSRDGKLARFYEECQPDSNDRVLDIGVFPGVGWSTTFGHEEVENFLERSYPWPSRIVAISVDPLQGFRERFTQTQAVQADACRLPFRDGSFDIVFSNAVIEHVGGRERQKLFVQECLRVSRRAVFIAAPNRLFPYDAHIGLPLVHLLPRRCWRGLTSDALLHLLYPWTFLGNFPRESKPRILSPWWAPSIAVVATSRGLPRGGSGSGPRPCEPGEGAPVCPAFMTAD